jgi:hypothetical protein
MLLWVAAFIVSMALVWYSLLLRFIWQLSPKHAS